jgi:hypothetical protein
VHERDVGQIDGDRHASGYLARWSCERKEIHFIARIKQPGRGESDWVVTSFDPGRCFAWKTTRPALRMVGMRDISAERGGTKNVPGVEASGAIAVLLWPILRLALRRARSGEPRTEAAL